VRVAISLVLDTFTFTMSLMESYLKAIEPFYVDSLQKLAHDLSVPELCFGIPLVYFALTMTGYGLMRFVNFHSAGSGVSALKGGKKMSPARILSVIGNDKFEVQFSGDRSVEVLDKKDISPNGFAPPDWFKSVYNLAQVLIGANKPNHAESYFFVPKSNIYLIFKETPFFSCEKMVRYHSNTQIFLLSHHNLFILKYRYRCPFTVVFSAYPLSSI
jgi:hypothetical protein